MDNRDRPTSRENVSDQRRGNRELYSTTVRHGVARAAAQAGISGAAKLPGISLDLSGDRTSTLRSRQCRQDRSLVSTCCPVGIATQWALPPSVHLLPQTPTAPPSAHCSPRIHFCPPLLFVREVGPLPNGRAKTKCGVGKPRNGWSKRTAKRPHHAILPIIRTPTYVQPPASAPTQSHQADELNHHQ